MVGETAKRKRAPFLVLLLVMLMVLLHTSECGATSSIMKGNASSPYHARIDEPADWMFDSEITRMLADKPHRVTDGSKNSGKPAVPCGKGKQYLPCTNGGPPPPHCNSYNRGC
ncbi:hypothetical protein FH972_007676 [Carpinus fangiana]|uniref:Uncharacterized protein n=1 Tax=Carpinus fangiana TaxID=176857 RepID=A0A5N6QZ13_9ROSI|nr:hypothetical protein FH972_007676 [Carpinus fangiana]